MTAHTSHATPHLPGRRPRRAVARDLLVAALCALVVAGFLLDVSRGAGTGRPAGRGATSLSS